MAGIKAIPSRFEWLQRLVLDCCIIILIAIVTTTFRKVVSPVHQGFSCHDPRLQQPFNTDPASVSNGVLYGVGFGLPAGLMILFEGFLAYQKRHPNDKIRARDCLLPMVQKSFEAIVPFFFGGAVTHLTTNVPKYAIGRLRPHFFDVCKPDWSRVNCSNGGYIMDDICTETNKKLIDKARVAFPSGHASLSMYFMLYLILYLQRRVNWSGCSLLLPLIQLGLFYMALYCGLTRLSDRLHHWEDVFAGDVLGAAIAIIVTMKVKPTYTPPEEHPGSVEKNDDDDEVIEDSLEEGPMVEMKENGV